MGFQISVYVDENPNAELENRAEKADMSKSAYAARILEEYVEEAQALPGESDQFDAILGAFTEAIEAELRRAGAIPVRPWRTLTNRRIYQPTQTSTTMRVNLFRWTMDDDERRSMVERLVSPGTSRPSRTDD